MNESAAEVLMVARRMLDGDLDLIEGCRLLVHHLREVGIAREPDALTILGIESETDHLPIGDERARWHPAALAQKDRERDEYVDRVRPELMDACRSIVSRLSAS